MLDDVDSGDTLAPSGSQLAGEDLLRRDFLNVSMVVQNTSSSTHGVLLFAVSMSLLLVTSINF